MSIFNLETYFYINNKSLSNEICNDIIKYFDEETVSKYEGVTCPGNAWDLNNYNPAVNYPADLASALMRMVCLLPGSVILDPFMGGASGIEAAVECGHSFIGYESNTDRYNKYSKVLKRVQKQIDERDADHERTEA